MALNENSISILIIEDDPASQVLLKTYLGNTHLTVSSTTMTYTIAEEICYLRQQS